MQKPNDDYTFFRMFATYMVISPAEIKCTLHRSISTNDIRTEQVKTFYYDLNNFASGNYKTH
jgi:hypothetical protein